MVKKLAIFSLAVAAALSCGQRQVGGFHPRPFPQASVPAMVTDRAEAASFFAEHFWDEFTDTTQLYFCDSSTVNGVKLTDVEQEQNGIYNYDRTEKFDMDRIRAIFSKVPKGFK